MRPGNRCAHRDAQCAAKRPYRYAIRLVSPPSQRQHRLVAIDPASIEKIGVWPWPRQIHAELVDKLESAGATDIVFDVDFSSPSNPASDRAFADALQKAGGSVVLPAFKQLVGDGEDGRSIHVNRPLPQFDKDAWSAVVNVAVEPDGVVRRYSFGETLNGEFLPSVGALLAGRYETQETPLQIDFSIRPDSLPTVSYVDVLRGDPLPRRCSKAKKSLSARPRSNSATDSTCRTAASSRPSPADAGGRIDPTRPGAASVIPCRDTGGLGFIVLLMMALWRRASAGLRVVVLVGLAGVGRIRRRYLAGRSCPSSSIPRSGMWRRRLSRRLGARRDRFSRPVGQDRGKALPEDCHVARRWTGVHRSERPDHGLESRRGGDFRLSSRGNNRPAAQTDLRLARRRRKFTSVLDSRTAARSASGSGGKVMELEGAERTARYFRWRPVSPNGKASKASNMAR